jgi:hypothetical protein
MPLGEFYAPHLSLLQIRQIAYASQRMTQAIHPFGRLSRVILYLFSHLQPQAFDHEANPCQVRDFDEGID